MEKSLRPLSENAWKTKRGRCWRCDQPSDTWAGKSSMAPQGCFAIQLQETSTDSIVPLARWRVDNIWSLIFWWTVTFLPVPQAWTGPDFAALWHQQENGTSVLHSWCYTHLMSTFVQQSNITLQSEEGSQLKTTKCIKLLLDVCRLNNYFLVTVNECRIFVEIKKDNTFVLSVMSIVSVSVISC